MLFHVHIDVHLSKTAEAHRLLEEQQVVGAVVLDPQY